MQGCRAKCTWAAAGQYLPEHLVTCEEVSDASCVVQEAPNDGIPSWCTGEPLTMSKAANGQRCELRLLFEGVHEVFACEVVSTARIIELYGSTEDEGDTYWQSSRSKESIPGHAGLWYCSAFLSHASSPARVTGSPLLVKLFSLSAPTGRCVLHGIRLRISPGAAPPPPKAPHPLFPGTSGHAAAGGAGFQDAIALAARFMSGQRNLPSPDDVARFCQGQPQAPPERLHPPVDQTPFPAAQPSPGNRPPAQSSERTTVRDPPSAGASLADVEHRFSGRMAALEAKIAKSCEAQVLSASTVIYQHVEAELAGAAAAAAGRGGGPEELSTAEARIAAAVLRRAKADLRSELARAEPRAAASDPESARAAEKRQAGADGRKSSAPSSPSTSPPPSPADSASSALPPPPENPDRLDERILEATKQPFDALRQQIAALEIRLAAGPQTGGELGPVPAASSSLAENPELLHKRILEATKQPFDALRQQIAALEIRLAAGPQTGGELGPVPAASSSLAENPELLHKRILEATKQPFDALQRKFAALETRLGPQTGGELGSGLPASSSLAENPELLHKRILEATKQPFDALQRQIAALETRLAAGPQPGGGLGPSENWAADAVLAPLADLRRDVTALERRLSALSPPPASPGQGGGGLELMERRLAEKLQREVGALEARLRGAGGALKQEEVAVLQDRISTGVMGKVNETLAGFQGDIAAAEARLKSALSTHALASPRPGPNDAAPPSPSGLADLQRDVADLRDSFAALRRSKPAESQHEPLHPGEVAVLQDRITAAVLEKTGEALGALEARLAARMAASAAVDDADAVASLRCEVAAVTARLSALAAATAAASEDGVTTPARQAGENPPPVCTTGPSSDGSAVAGLRREVSDLRSRLDRHDLHQQDAVSARVAVLVERQVETLLRPGSAAQTRLGRFVEGVVGRQLEQQLLPLHRGPEPAAAPREIPADAGGAGLRKQPAETPPGAPGPNGVARPLRSNGAAGLESSAAERGIHGDTPVVGRDVCDPRARRQGDGDRHPPRRKGRSASLGGSVRPSQRLNDARDERKREKTTCPSPAHAGTPTTADHTGAAGHHQQQQHDTPETRKSGDSAGAPLAAPATPKFSGRQQQQQQQPQPPASDRRGPQTPDGRASDPQFNYSQAKRFFGFADNTDFQQWVSKVGQGTPPSLSKRASESLDAKRGRSLSTAIPSEADSRVQRSPSQCDIPVRGIMACQKRAASASRSPQKK
ncbi:hypothetical protein DIPPA_01121 [Diplonema papillatum]|nr:hypothetical protein DIPPA_01121 [Diplonema papillatum]